MKMKFKLLTLFSIWSSCTGARGFSFVRGPILQRAGNELPPTRTRLRGRAQKNQQHLQQQDRQHRTLIPTRNSRVLGSTRYAANSQRKSPGRVLLSAADETADTSAAAGAEATTAAGVPSRAESLPTPAVTTQAAASNNNRRTSFFVSGGSLAAIVLADINLRQAFVRATLTFPSSLAGMVGLFVGLVALERVAPSSAEKAVGILEPGSAVLTRWLPVFFAPSLVVLPLSPALTSTNALKLSLLVCGGWFFSLASTAAVVTTLSFSSSSSSRAGASAADDTTAETSVTTGASPAAEPADAPPSRKPAVAAAASLFRAPLILGLGVGAALSGVLAVAGAASGKVAPGALLAKLSKPAAQLSLLLATLFGFTAGTRAPRRVSKAVHPVVTCAAVTMATAAAIGKGVGVGFTDMLRSYLTKSRCPVHLGAGDLLLGLLGPSVLSFAVQMYRRRALIFKNAKQVAGGSIYCASSGLFGTALVSRLLGLPTSLRLATLSRNITSPLAMAICSLIGADPSLAIAIVVVTGVLGANFGITALDALGVKDPAARGLAQGGSAHGLGTAAMVNEPTCLAFSAVAMALTATASTVLVSIPSVRTALLRLALGAASTGGVPVVAP